MDYRESLPIISQIVREVGETYLNSTTGYHKTKKEDGSYVTDTDVQIDRVLHEKLGEAFPDIKFVSEELDSDTTHTQGLNWCIDPIDGTHNYMNGIPYYAISVGLVLDGEPLLGVIYDPHSKNVLSGGKGLGVFVNDIPFTRTSDSMIITSGRSHHAEDKKREQQAINSILEGKLMYRRFSSLALDIMNLVLGKIGAVRVVGNSMWDWSAGYAIAQEIGLSITHHSSNNFIIYDPQLSEHVSVLK